MLEHGIITVYGIQALMPSPLKYSMDMMITVKRIPSSIMIEYP
jgi:hypothetical protein